MHPQHTRSTAQKQSTSASPPLAGSNLATSQKNIQMPIQIWGWANQGLPNKYHWQGALALVK